MLTAVILINVKRGSTPKVAQEIISIKGVQKVFSVTGRFDLIAIVEAADMDALSKISNNQLDNISDISKIETLVSMQIYSQDSLEGMFSVGLDDDT